MARQTAISSDIEAETLALSALAWLATESDMVQGFIATSGASPDMFGELVHSRAFLVSLLEFLTSNDDQVLAFAAHAGVDPMRPLEALRRLQGEAHRNWT